MEISLYNEHYKSTYRKRVSKIIALIITILILLMMFLWMKYSVIKKRNIIEKHYDEIDWMRFTPKPIVVEKKASSASNKEKSPESAKAKSVQRIRVDNLLDQLNLSSLNLETKSLQKTGKSRKTSMNKKIKVEISSSSFESDFNLSFDENSPLISSSITRNNRKKSGNVEINALSGTDAGSGLASLGEEIGADLKGPTSFGMGGGGNGISVGLKDIGAFGEDFEDFSGLYRPLVEWMKLHPAKLPPVVNKFMSFQPGDLTSWVNFNIQDRIFEMFLLCVEATYEVRIVLVEKDFVTYLIDQGFKKKSNYLRVGKIVRLENGEILKFGTNLMPANNKHTVEFYQIFLSWWEEVKNEVES